jgi:hypothetical protein
LTVGISVILVAIIVAWVPIAVCVAFALGRTVVIAERREAEQTVPVLTAEPISRAVPRSSRHLYAIVS